MDDRAVTCGNETDPLAPCSGFLVPGHHKDTRGDLARVAGLVKEGPDVAGLVLVVEIGSDIYLVHRRPPLLRSRFQGTRDWAAERRGLRAAARVPIVGAAQADGEVWALRGGQQLKSALSQPARSGQVDGAERGEPAAEQIIERLAENAEDRDAQQRLPVKRPGPRRSLHMAAQLVRR